MFIFVAVLYSIPVPTLTLPLLLILTFFQPILFSVQGLYASAIAIAPLASFISFAYATPKRLLIPNLLFWAAAAVIVYNHLG